jgi:dienelactone hydrolase
MREKDNDPRAFDLYDDDCHGRIDRRTFFGRARATAEVPKIRAPMLVHLAEDDQRVSATWPDSEAALKATGVSYESYAYTGADFTTIRPHAITRQQPRARAIITWPTRALRRAPGKARGGRIVTLLNQRATRSGAMDRRWRWSSLRGPSPKLASDRTIAFFRKNLA